MPTKNEVFLLAKMNVLENITAQLLAMFGKLLQAQAPDFVDIFESEIRTACKRANVLQGSADGAFEVQAEMLKQLDSFFQIARRFRENM